MRSGAWAVMVLVAVLVAPVDGRAQDAEALRRMAEQWFGPGLSQADLLDRVRQSGVTRYEARSRLLQMGYDPGLADRYFDYAEATAGAVPRGAESGLLGGLPGAGVPGRVGVDGVWRDRMGMDPVRPHPWWMPELEAEPDTLEIFGRSVFRRLTSEFAPMTRGPVDPDYRLGPGDEVSLVLTGDVELAYTLPINREGYFVIPDVGRVLVNGLTLSELEERLYDRLGRVYSGVRRDGSATTHVQVSLGRLRPKQVFVIGEVEWPNAYQVSGAATVFHALYLAGGPSRSGSFRNVEVRRGGEVIVTVDLYEYLLHGDGRADVRLEHGDIIFVPEFTRHVTIQGSVRRPAIYELLEGEDLRDAIRFAGGFDAVASAQRVQIDRILTPEERRPGVDRVLVDVDPRALADAARGAIPVRDGDLVQVFTVSDERRNRVVVTGAVRRPGVYEWLSGLTLWGLIDRADGLGEMAYTPRAHIYRLNEVDGSRRLIRTHLLGTGADGADVALADLDSVVVFSRQELRNPDSVAIDGYVRNPGTYAVAQGMSVRDLILSAGGFAEGADTRRVEVARRMDPRERRDTTAIVLQVPIDSPNGALPEDIAAKAAYAYGGVDPVMGRDDVPFWAPDSSEFVLRHGDRVFVRRAPGFEAPRTVSLTGEIHYPGTYVLENRRETISGILERAGGLTPEAYASGLTLYRGGKLVATDLPAVLRDPASRYNVVLQPGDSLHVPTYDPTVFVTGAVTFESRILYDPGKGLDHYVNQAGGYTDLAEERRVIVTYQDGERSAVRRRLYFFRSKPRIQPGSTIYVPSKPEANQGVDWGTVLTRTTAILSTLATVMLAVDRVAGGS